MVNLINTFIKLVIGEIIVKKYLEYHYNPFLKLIGQDNEYNKLYNYSYVCNCFSFNIIDDIDINSNIRLNILKLLLDKKNILRVRLKSSKYYYDNSDSNIILKKILFANLDDLITPELALVNIKNLRQECGIYVSNKNIIVITNTTIFNGSILHLFVNSLFNSCIKNENICKYYNNFNYIPLFSEVLLINTLINLTIPKVRNLSYDSFNNIDSSSIYIHNKIPLNILKTYKRFYNLKFNSIICGMICNIIFESSKVDKLHIALNIGYNSKKLYNNKKGYNRFNNSGIIPIIVNRNSLINIINEIDIKIKKAKKIASATYFFNTVWNYKWNNNGFDIIFNNVPLAINNELLVENLIINDYKVLVPHSRTPIFASCFSDLDYVHFSLSIRSNDIDEKKCKEYDINNFNNILKVDI